jgi:N-dimethylarginine dimethylaminohydrolase
MINLRGGGATMQAGWGGNSMVWKLRSVLVFPPVEPLESPDWRDFGYLRPMNHRQAVEEHAAFRELLQVADVEVISGELEDARLQDGIFPYDPSFITDGGAVICRMGKPLRNDEPAVAEAVMRDLGIPILGRIESLGTLEGGDCLWLDESTLVIGRGYRSNAEGIRQMAELLAPQGVEVVAVGLPYWHGPDECLHLLSLISMLDEDLAVVYLPLLEASFVEHLCERGIRLVPIPDEEFATQGCNVLVTAPRQCILLKENQVTAELLREAGCEVTTYSGGEISHNRAGGPTCLTRPLLRTRE